jgi:hypothetical protein
MDPFRFDYVSPIMTASQVPHVDYATTGTFMNRNDRTEYPFYASTVPSDTLAARAVADLLAA